MLTGLFAVLAAIALAAGTAQGRRAAIVWNIFGRLDFAVAMTLGLVTSLGRFQMIIPNVQSIGAAKIARYPSPSSTAAVVVTVQ